MAALRTLDRSLALLVLLARPDPKAIPAQPGLLAQHQPFLGLRATRVIPATLAQPVRKATRATQEQSDQRATLVQPVQTVRAFLLVDCRGKFS
ncbi:hypothetical protein A8V01_19565 [Novosphingobium guangzhouense]|uniref:Uncharacterized protein n=1 Tax=Novosphingobium guangzhouense TaxID=1850347 RepID=A0A2K2G0N0_9SPHN|nr:hypothetical protein A8V01_19565 [Novosphingobium guangzhouense]